MYKEFRELSRVGAVEALYQDLAARHRARFRSVHVSQSPERRVWCLVKERELMSEVSCFGAGSDLEGRRD